MNRAHVDDDGLREIALALARYLSSECRLDPNPSGHRLGHTADPVKLGTIAVPSDDVTPPLVPDLEYSIKEAAALTHKAEATIRKYLSIGRLEGRKEGSRVYLTGKELARFMSREVESGSSDGASAEP